MIFTIIRSVALSAACVHSNYHTPNKEIVIGRCGIRECMHSKIYSCAPGTVKLYIQMILSHFCMVKFYIQMILSHLHCEVIHTNDTLSFA